MNIYEYASSLVGVIVPVLVQLARGGLFQCSGKAAFYLSLVVSVICVSISYLSIDTTPTIKEFIPNAGIAFTLSQIVYKQLTDKIKSIIPKK